LRLPITISYKKLAIVGLLLPIVNFSSQLQAAPPDAGQILRDTQQPVTPPQSPAPEITGPAKPVSTPTNDATSEVRVKVTGFTFTGNAAISEDVLQATVADSLNKSLNFGELIGLVDKVEAVYKQAGYFLAQAYIPPQKIKDGIIEITIAEGRLGEARLEGESRIKPEIVYGYLDYLPKGSAIKLSDIERQVLLINDLTGSHVTLDLQASETPDSTDVIIAQKADPLFTGRVEVNNYGLPATGQNRIGIYLNANSPLQLGDRLSGNLLRSDNGNLVSYGLSYDLPVGGRGWRLNAGISRSEYTLGDLFKNLNASGTVESYRAGVSYPFIRSRAKNLSFRLDAIHNDLVDHYRAIGFDSDKSSNALAATLSADWQDSWLGGGFNRVDYTLTSGHLGLSNSAKQNDTLNTEGGYSKVLLTLQRQQYVRPNLVLFTQLIHQHANDNLDSSEKFSIGGPSTLPGYATGETSTDQGTLAKAKLSWRVRDDIYLGVFADYAFVTFNKYPAVANNHKHFSDAGFSIDWQGPKGLSANAMMAWAITEAPNPADNDRPRIWANLGYNW